MHNSFREVGKNDGSKNGIKYFTCQEGPRADLASNANHPLADLHGTNQLSRILRPACCFLVQTLMKL